MNKDYVQGFVDKCAAAGIDPEELLKAAQGAQPMRVPRKFGPYKVPQSSGLFSGIFGSKTLPALPDPEVVAGVRQPTTDIRATGTVAGSMGARNQQLQNIKEQMRPGAK